MIKMGALKEGSKDKGDYEPIAKVVQTKKLTPENFVRNFEFCECTCCSCHKAEPCMEY